MVFKLVRTDTEEPSKIRLPLGTHLIGRGKFLEVDDKRVSRNHGELIIDEDTVTLKALHANPCFFLKKGTTKVELLLRGNSVELKNGDQFGLLPDTYWYQLIYCNLLESNGISSDIIVNNEVDQNRTEEQTLSIVNEQEVNNILNRPESPSFTQSHSPQREATFSAQRDSPSSIQRESPSLIQRDSQLTERDSPLLNQIESPSLVQRDSPLMQRVESPSLLQRAESPPITERPESPSLITQQLDSITQNNDQDAAGPSNDEQTPTKRLHSPVDSKEGIKKVKIEPQEVKEETTVKQEPQERQENEVRPDDDERQQSDNATAGPSNDQRGADTAGNAQGGMPTPTKPGPGRERCWYGANCYRRNSQHKLEFCHPGDAEWGAGERGLCPWGSRCRRRDPRHWLHHDHPPGTRPPPPQNRPGMQIVQRHGNIIYINANSVIFNDDGVHVEDSDDSVDIDYDF